MSQGTVRISPREAHFKATLARHKAFWERAEENSFLHSVAVFASSTPVSLPQRNGQRVTRAERLKPDMIDLEAIIDAISAYQIRDLDAELMARGVYWMSAGLGDMLPLARPFAKIPWIEAMLGCPIRMTEGQIWDGRYAGDPEEVIARGANFEHNPWFQLYLEYIRLLQERVTDRFAVSCNTLLRGASDLAAAVMGVQEACIGWIEQPKLMARLMRVCTDAILAVIEGGYKVLRPFHGGYPNNWAIWAPAPAVWTQADHSVLLSPKMYQKQILPYDVEVIKSCPISTMHLHNAGLHIAPLLVEIPELTSIEVAVDPYPTPERKPYEMEMYQLIQQHKALIVDFNFPDLEESEQVLSQLSRRGLCFNERFAPEVFAQLPAHRPGSQTWILG